MTASIAAPALRATDTLGLRSSGTSPGPRLHLFGVGAVGRAFLRLCSREGLSVIAATDSQATTYARDGLDALAIAAHKERGGSLAELAASARLTEEVALGVVPSDILVEAAPTDLDQSQRAVQRVELALRGGGRVALASKSALVRAARRLLAWGGGGRVGANAALGGTGRHLAAELSELSARCGEVALVANATSGVVLDALSRGVTLAEGLSAAASAGLLEGDATLDLDGTDAATKLAIVVGALWERELEARAIPRGDLRALDPRQVWRAAQRGRVTRIVARATREGEACVALEELPAGSPLAAPPGAVVYAYQLGRGGLRVHLGHGVGPDGTARALLEDVRDLARGGGR